MKISSIILLIVVAVFAIGLGASYAGSTSQYATFDEARKSGETVHVVGTWVNRQAAVYEPSQDMFTFFLQDTVGRVQQVVYRDPKPNDFEKAEKILVVGKFDTPGLFSAEKIIMKCPSKYGDNEVK
jgi:cytochrome c-type biogenesis protein CcmE